MIMKRLFLFNAISLAIMLITGTSQAQDDISRADPIHYETRIQGLENTGLGALLEQISDLRRQENSPPLSFGGLQSRLNNDISTFIKVLESEGYYQSAIASRFDRGQEPIRIIIDVIPGPRYMINSISINYTGTGPEQITKERLVREMTLVTGAPGRAEDIVLSEQALIRKLPLLGYPFAKTGKRRVVVDHADQSVQITYAIDAGPKIRFGRTVFDGTETVDRPYLMRLVPWQEGDVYDQSSMDLLRDRLYQTGLFSVVDMTIAEGETGGRRDILISVKDGAHRTVGFGAGYSSTEGFGGDVFWEHRNFLGRQEKLRLTAKFAEIEQSLTGEFSKPNFLRFDQTFVAKTGFAREDTDAFTLRTFSASAGVDRVFGENWAGSAGIDLEYTSEDDDNERRNFLLAGLPVTLRWDNTNDLLDPHEGARVALRVTPYLAEQNSGFQFTAVEISNSAYVALDKDDRYIIAGRTRLGSITGAALDRLPGNKRFYAGGGGSIRGYGYQEVGPVDADGMPTGGRSLVELGLEFRARITESIGLVPFIEGGNVYQDRFPKFSDLRFGAGLGFRYYTDFAPIRLDIAFPIDKRPTDQIIQFYISLGQSF